MQAAWALRLPDRAPEFDSYVNSGKKVKWAVPEKGDVVVVSIMVGRTGVYRSVLGGGMGVQAAGEATLLETRVSTMVWR